MSSTVTIRKVESKQDHKAFFEFPWTLYKDDSNWVPPLCSIRRDTLNREKNPAWEYLEGDYYLAWRGDEVVGTIAAFVNHHHNEYNDENIAWFGFFECYDDQDIADALLNTAIEWARSHGYDGVRGPQNFTTHEECGLLVDGFEPSVLLMPYNPPYYQALVENRGFQKVKDVYSFYGDFNPDTFSQERNYARLKKLVKRITRNGDVTVRHANRKDLQSDFKLFQQIYNEAWSENWGFTPMTDGELKALIDSMKLLFDPKLSAIVELDGEPVGFMIGIPDFNTIFHRVYPRPSVPEIFTLLNIVRHWKISNKMHVFRVPLMGVKSEYRKRGLDLVMYDLFVETIVQRKVPYYAMDCGWILEDNHDMVGVLKGAGLQIYKTHRFYELALEGES